MKTAKEIFQKYIVGIMITLSVTFGGTIITTIYKIYNVPADVEVMKAFVMLQDSLNKMQGDLNKQFADSSKIHSTWAKDHWELIQKHEIELYGTH